MNRSCKYPGDLIEIRDSDYTYYGNFSPQICPSLVCRATKSRTACSSLGRQKSKEKLSFEAFSILLFLRPSLDFRRARASRRNTEIRERRTDCTGTSNSVWYMYGRVSRFGRETRLSKGRREEPGLQRYIRKREM